MKTTARKLGDKTRSGKKRPNDSSAETLLRAAVSSSKSHVYGVALREKAAYFRSSIQNVMLYARRDASADYDGFFEKLRATTEFATNKFSTEPIDYDYLISQRTAVPILPLEEEIRWLSERINFHSALIREFLTERTHVQHKFLAGEFESALAAIESLQAKFGASLWSVELTIAINNLAIGDDGQKEYLRAVRRLRRKGLLPFFAVHVSQRCEDTVSFGWFQENLKRRLSVTEKTPAALYGLHKLCCTIPQKEADIATYLRVEQNHHEIDVYETFISTAQHLVSSSLHSRILPSLKKALQRLVHLQDDRIFAAIWKMDETKGSQRTQRCEALDELVGGNARRGLKLAISTLKFEPDSFTNFLSAAFSLSLGKPLQERLERCPRSYLCRTLSNVLRKDRESTANAEVLRKFCFVFNGLNLAKALLNYLAIEETGSPLNLARDLRQLALHLPIESSLGVSAFENAGQTNLGPAQMILHAVVTASPEPRVCSVRDLSAFVDARASAIKGEAAKAIVELRALQASSVRWIAAHAARLLTYLYAEAGDIKNSVETISREVITHGTPSLALPIEGLFKDATWSDMQDSTMLQLANCLTIYAEHSNDSRAATHRRFAVNSLLNSMGISKPSQLPEDQISTLRGEAMFFLSDVCTEPVLDMVRAVKGSRATAEERRAIYGVLRRIHGEQTPLYHREIVELTHQLTIHDGLAVVDKSRVHVDKIAIKNLARRELAESFSRYLSLRDAGVGLSDNFEAVLRNIQRAETSAKYNLPIPENEADDVLLSMLDWLRKKFLHDVPHGLDSYLSKRVRHGSIVSHVRDPIEKEHLILLRDSTGRYQPTFQWNSIIPSVDINPLLATFSRSVDDQLVHLRDVLLHVKNERHPVGIFDVQFVGTLVHLIRSSFSRYQTLDTFIDTVFETMWVLLSPALIAARKAIEQDLKAHLVEQFDLLTARVSEAVGNSTGYQAIANAIRRASVNTQARIDSAAGWFQAHTIENRDYSIQEAFAIAAASMKLLRSNFRPKIDVRGDLSRTIEAVDLSILVDVICIVLNNTASHSNFGPEPEIVVKVATDVSARCVCIDFESDTAKPTLDDASKLERIRVELADGSYEHKVREEGESGFHKLKSIANLSSHGDLQFGYRGDSKFFVCIRFDVNASEGR